MKLATRPAVRRIIQLDGMIRTGRYPNACSAAEELEVNRRTVQRDLAFLRDDWGAPLEFCHRNNGYYYRDKDFSLPALRLSERELVAMFLAERLMQAYRGTPFASELATIFNKLTASLSRDVTLDLNHLREAYSFRVHPAAAGDIRVFQQLATAVRDGRQLEITYWSASRDETRRRVVDPYHLASLEGEWYLIGFCHLRRDIRMFVPGRMRSVRETGERVEPPIGFSIDKYLDGAFRSMRGEGAHKVRLRFTPAAARYIREKVWHPTQAMRERKNGDVVLTFCVSHLLEVKRWALSFGADCEVLAPMELRNLVEEEHRRALKSYRQLHH